MVKKFAGYIWSRFKRFLTYNEQPTQLEFDFGDYDPYVASLTEERGGHHLDSPRRRRLNNPTTTCPLIGAFFIINFGDMKFYKLRDVKSPQRANSTDSGIDFFIPEDFSPITVRQGDNIKINMGVSVIIPEGYDLQFVNKSGIASKTGIILGAQLVDRGYTGEIILNLIATGKEEFEITPGLKITQAVLRPINLIEPQEIGELEFHTEVVKTSSERGDGGFGSTGI